ncbi:23658_t:CDS:2 [Gigaspora rosea]|nr:23658_t:CDS:2 [Gigaspora rosea]
MSQTKRDSWSKLNTNLAVIRSNNQERKEIQYEVQQRHDMNGTVFDDITNLIGEVTENKEPSKCAKCDNCHCHIKDNPTIRDVTPDIEELVHVVKILMTTYNHQIIPADVIGVFRRSNAARMRKFGYQQLEEFYNYQDIKKSKKPKLLSTTELAKFALQDLVRRGLVLQDIILLRQHETRYISCTLVIKGLSDGAKEIVKEQE